MHLSSYTMNSKNSVIIIDTAASSLKNSRMAILAVTVG